MISELIASTALALGVPAELMQAVCWVESNHRRVLVVRDGGSPSHGPCQIKLETARMFNRSLSRADMLVPEVSVFYATLYMRRQLKRYRGHVGCATIAYNAGRSRQDFCKTFDIVTQFSNNVYSNKVQEALRSKPWMAIAKH